MELYKPSLLVAKYIDILAHSLADFKKIIISEKLQNKMTCMLIDDFDHGEEFKMISIIQNFNGVYKKFMEAPIPITSIWDKEKNILYVAFSNPLKAFEFALNLKTQSLERLKRFF